jgi:hypothetical protein
MRSPEHRNTTTNNRPPSYSISTVRSEAVRPKRLFDGSTVRLPAVPCLSVWRDNGPTWENRSSTFRERCEPPSREVDGYSNPHSPAGYFSPGYGFPAKDQRPGGCLRTAPSAGRVLVLHRGPLPSLRPCHPVSKRRPAIDKKTWPLIA